ADAARNNFDVLVRYAEQGRPRRQRNNFRQGTVAKVHGDGESVSRARIGNAAADGEVLQRDLATNFAPRKGSRVHVDIGVSSNQVGYVPGSYRQISRKQTEAAAIDPEHRNVEGCDHRAVTARWPGIELG